MKRNLSRLRMFNTCFGHLPALRFIGEHLTPGAVAGAWTSRLHAHTPWALAQGFLPGVTSGNHAESFRVDDSPAIPLDRGRQNSLNAASSIDLRSGLSHRPTTRSAPRIRSIVS